jgi:predicted transglutaminase-like cysteine proteinase
LRFYVLLLPVVIATFCLSHRVYADAFPLTEAQSKVISNDYGIEALARISGWKELMQVQQGLPEMEKLTLVNQFFNERLFLDDIIVWKVKDYWATPIEFLSRDAGDCEDYSIAKYFTLKEMGVPLNKLRITYVKAIELNQAHMVLTYSERPGDVPLVLDNLIPEIKLASKRKDLRPIYSFNGESLWMLKEMSQGKKGRENRLNRWSDLVGRMK